MGARAAIAEDFEFDPTYSRQRRAASYLLGIALNMGRRRGHMREPETVEDRMKQLDLVEQMAVTFGIITFDEFHHAPLCDANHWHKKRMPTGPCSCGAAAAGLLSTRAGE
jgi:hypothetical protein